jgi:excisionase family DNA binding protein
MDQHLIPAGLARVAEAAEFLNISRSKLYQMMEAKELAYVKLGKSRRIRWSELLKLVEQHTVAGQVDEA